MVRLQRAGTLRYLKGDDMLTRGQIVQIVQIANAGDRKREVWWKEMCVELPGG